MTHFSDNLYLGGLPSRELVGKAIAPGYGGFGIGPMGQVWVYDITPVALDPDGIAVAQGLTSGTPMTLNGALVSGGTGVFDVPRSVTITGQSATNLSGINFTIVGTDYYNKPMSQVIAGPNGAVVVQTTKAFMTVTSVTPNGTNAAQVIVGSGDRFGLPFRVTGVQDVVSVRWAAVAGFDTGTIVAGDATSPATTSTGDVRGTYAPSTASNGTNRLVVVVHAPVSQIGPDVPSHVNVFGVRQNLDA